jgi:glutathione synthase/RimK-type ligase-like ATP-grasp enzyme
MTEAHLTGKMICNNVTTSPDYVVIADPASLRWQHYQRDLDRHLTQFRPRPDLHLLQWSDVIERDGEIEELLPAGSSLLRVESPARDFSLFRLLMRAGEIDCGRKPSQWIRDEGWIASPRMLYLGLCRILANIDNSLLAHGRCCQTSNLTATQTLMDKNAVSKILQVHGIPTPDAFQPTSVAGMLSEIWARGWEQTYVKLAYGSCASGIALLDAIQGSTSSAITTVKRISQRFYNTYDVHRVQSKELESILRFLVDEVATVQKAIPKTRVDGDELDLRVVVIDGQVAASVFRASPLPFTNLHLGGYRADPQRSRRGISDRSWADAMDVCRQAARLFDIAALGIDLAFDRHTMQPNIVEINAFGDFLPGSTDDQGRSIHQLEIAATAARFER